MGTGTTATERKSETRPDPALVLNFATPAQTLSRPSHYNDTAMKRCPPPDHTAAAALQGVEQGFASSRFEGRRSSPPSTWSLPLNCCPSGCSAPGQVTGLWNPMQQTPIAHLPAAHEGLRLQPGYLGAGSAWSCDWGTQKASRARLGQRPLQGPSLGMLHSERALLCREPIPASGPFPPPLRPVRAGPERLPPQPGPGAGGLPFGRARAAAAEACWSQGPPGGSSTTPPAASRPGCAARSRPCPCPFRSRRRRPAPRSPLPGPATLRLDAGPGWARIERQAPPQHENSPPGTENGQPEKERSGARDDGISAPRPAARLRKLRLRGQSGRGSRLALGKDGADLKAAGQPDMALEAGSCDARSSTPLRV